MEQTKKQIGIPRSMYFYHNYPFLFGFLSDLGIEIVLSDATTKKTVSDGASLVVTETCLPIKIFVGHVLNLLDKGVTKILVPSIQSIAPKIYNCSKIRGLPDLIRNVVKREFDLIEPTLDKSAKSQGFYQFLRDTVKPFGITNEKLIKRASKTGWKVYNNFMLMIRSGMSYKKAMSYALQGKISIETNEKEYPINVALVSHGYNIYDDRASMKIFDKLEGMDVKVMTSLQLTEEQLKEGMNYMDRNIYWANEYEMTATAGHYLKDNRVDGIILLTSFGCGPDSLMIERIIRQAKSSNKPILSLTIDEHTGEAGFITRLEAFVDMLYRKKRSKLIDKLDIKEYDYIPQTNVCDSIINV